ALDPRAAHELPAAEPHLRSRPPAWAPSAALRPRATGPGRAHPHPGAAAVPVPPALVLAVLFPCLFVMHGRAPFAPVPAMLIALPEPSLLLLDISTIYRDSHHGKPRPVVVGRSPGRCAIGRAEDAAAGGLLVRVSRRWPTWAGTAAGSRGR